MLRLGWGCCTLTHTAGVARAPAIVIDTVGALRGRVRDGRAAIERQLIEHVPGSRDETLSGSKKHKLCDI